MKLLLIILAAAACVMPPKVSAERRAALRESPEATLEQCKYLGRFSGWSSQPAEKGMEQAREEARLRAAEAGATNFFYSSDSPMPDAVTVTVKGYDCGQAR